MMRACLCCCFFFLRIRRPPRSTRTDTLFPYTTLFRSVIETDHQIGSGRICRADVALLRQFIGNEIGILGKFKAAAELRIISHHGEALPLGGRQLLEARYIGAKGTRAARSEERRVGKACVSTCRSRGSSEN